MKLSLSKRSLAARIAERLAGRGQQVLQAEQALAPGAKYALLMKSREMLARMRPLSVFIEREEVELLGGVEAEWVGDATGTRILYLHGGAYVAGSRGSHRSLVRNIAHSCEGTALAIDYRLAPEHPYPAALEDAFEAYQWMLHHGPRGESGPPERVLIAGDSAGGGLVLSLLRRLREAGEWLPDGVVLLSPWADLTLAGPTYEDNANSDPALSRAYLEIAAEAYVGSDARTNPGVSPTFAEFAGLPPMYVQAGGDELLFSDSVGVVKKAREAGVTVEFDVWESMFHGWQFLSPFVPEAREAFDALADWHHRIIAGGS